MRALMATYAAVSVAGFLIAVDQARTCRFAWVPVPGSAVVHGLTIGSALSAPPLLLAIAGIAVWKRRAGVVGWCAALFLVGILGERDTWSAVRHPSGDVGVTSVVVLAAVLPVAMLELLRRRRDERVWRSACDTRAPGPYDAEMSSRSARRQALAGPARER